MCVVSMIMDHYTDKWKPYTVPQDPWNQPFYPAPPPNLDSAAQQKALEAFLKQYEAAAKPKEPAITDAEIKEFRALLERAREYDKRHNEPDCELAGKREALKTIAAALGVDISFVDAPDGAPA